MSNRRIALILTVSYWITAALVATFTPRSDWIDLRWPIAVYLFAIPTTILLWMVVIGVHFFRPGLPRSRFTLIGIALPVVYVSVAVGGGRWLTEAREQRVEEQLRIAGLAAFDDEPLAGTKGPIGVRLRYRVVYPQGLGPLRRVSPVPSHLGRMRSRRTLFRHFCHRRFSNQRLNQPHPTTVFVGPLTRTARKS